jgi:hypothetical protein
MENKSGVSDEFRSLFPQLGEEELLTARENLRQYVEIAMETRANVPDGSEEAPLTDSAAGASVRPGSEVEPQHLTTQHDA